MRKLLLSIIILIATLCLAFYCLLASLSYHDFLDHFFRLTSTEYLREGITPILSPEMYWRLKAALLFIFFAGSLSSFVLIKMPRYFSGLRECLRSVGEYPKWLWLSFKELKKTEKLLFGIFLAGIVLHRLFLGFTTEVIYDEAWTYLAFTSKNPLVAACFYPAANNHVLFSHLTQLTKLLPFSILTEIRIAAFIPGFLAIITLFFYLRKISKPLSAWIGILIFAFSFPISYYGFVARGYSLIVLFFVVGWISVNHIINDPTNNKAWYRLMISSVFGFYTIPVYLYPFISLFGFAFIYFVINKNKTAIIKTALFGSATVVLTFIAYLPIFVLTGIGSVINNKFVAPLTYKQVLDGFTDHVQNAVHFFTGNNYYYVFGIIFILMTIGVNFSRNNNIRIGTLFSIWCILLAPVFVFIHKVLPFERTWIYLMVPVIFLIVAFVNTTKWQFPILILTGTMIVINSFVWTKQMLWYDASCEEDYLQGKYFTEYLHGKKASVVTSSRMNSYLKFNKIQKKEDWGIHSELNETIPDGTWYIHYRKGDKPEAIPAGFTTKCVYIDYELLIFKP